MRSSAVTNRPYRVWGTYQITEIFRETSYSLWYNLCLRRANMEPLAHTTCLIELTLNYAPKPGLEKPQCVQTHQALPNQVFSCKFVLNTLLLEIEYKSQSRRHVFQARPR